MRNLFEKAQKEKKALSFYSALQLLFHVFSALYWLGYQLKLVMYRSGMLEPKKLKTTVISVGNVTLGGTGKTPLVIYLVQKLRERKLKVAILSRGYKRRKKELTELVKPDENSIHWTESGDEPYLLASRLNHVPVMVSKDRRTSGVRAQSKYQTEVLVLDDGFQHRKLFRDLDIVVIDATNPFGNSRIFPAGRLREPLSSLGRADIIVLNRVDQIADRQNLIAELRRYNQDAPIIESVYRVNSVERLLDHSTAGRRSPLRSEEKLQGKKALAFSGIGNPISFERSLKLLKVKVLKHHRFPDHFFYQKKDMLDLEKEAQELGADLMITTEKDSVRIPMINELEIPIWVFKIDLKITEGEQIFWNRIEGLLKHGNKS